MSVMSRVRRTPNLLLYSPKNPKACSGPQGWPLIPNVPSKSVPRLRDPTHLSSSEMANAKRNLCKANVPRR